MLRIAIALVFLLSSGTAFGEADEVTQAKARLDEVVKALNAGNAKAFAATFDADEGRIILPLAATEGFGGPGVQEATNTWLATMKGASFVYVNTKAGVLGTGAWYHTELVATAPKPMKWRMSGVLRDPDDGTGKLVHVAMHVSAAVEDKTVTALAKAKKLPALPPLSGSFDSGDWSEQVASANAPKTKWDLKGAVVGSAPKEVAFGPASGKLLGMWKGLKIKGREHARHRSVISPVALHVSMEHVTIAMKVGGKMVDVPFRVLLGYSTIEGSDGKPGKPILGIVHFSVATE